MDVSDSKVIAPAVQVAEKICEKHGAFTSRWYATLPSTGRELWTVCQECTREKEREQQELDRQQRIVEERRRVENRLNRACIPMRFRGKTLATFVAGSAEKQHALEVAEDFLERFEQHTEDGTTVVFSGRPGTGKSHLAIGIAQQLLHGGETAMYTTAREIVRMLRDTWRNGSEQSERQMLAELVGLSLLVIDEVGVGFGSDAEKVQFFDVIDGRYREQKPTILLTNLDRKGLAEYIGQRAFDRLRENGIWVAFEWESYRGK